MTDFEKFMELLRRELPGEITAADVDALRRAYPFFTLPAALRLKSGRDVTDEEAAQLKAAVALTSPDVKALMRMAGVCSPELADFYPRQESQATPTTESAIDKFLDTYGQIDPHEQDLLERLIFNPVPDYSSVLAKEVVSAEDAAGEVSEQDAMLDAFLARQQQVVEESVKAEERVVPEVHAVVKPAPDSSLNESLAKMYIKKRRYDKAYEIISQLSLNFPEKSVYFADQLRFLKKLIYNQEHGNKR